MALRAPFSRFVAASLRSSSPRPALSLTRATLRRIPRRCLHSSPHRFVLSQTPQSSPVSLPSSILPSTVLPSVSTQSPPARGPTASTPDTAAPLLSFLHANVAPLPCAYTPPEIAPLIDVKAVAKAMEEIIVSSADTEVGKDGQKAVEVEVKGLEELMADVKAKQEGGVKQLASA